MILIDTNYTYLWFIIENSYHVYSLMYIVVYTSKSTSVYFCVYTNVGPGGGPRPSQPKKCAISAAFMRNMCVFIAECAIFACYPSTDIKSLDSGSDAQRVRHANGARVALVVHLLPTITHCTHYPQFLRVHVIDSVTLSHRA